jgi:hypothetical protein
MQGHERTSARFPVAGLIKIAERRQSALVPWPEGPHSSPLKSLGGVNHLVMPGRTNRASLPFTAMEDHQPRFRCHPEPSGTWTVWDDVIDAPATLGGSILLGRTWQRAKVARDVLRRIYDSRLEARSLRRTAKPSAGAGRVDDLISSIRKRRED